MKTTIRIAAVAALLAAGCSASDDPLQQPKPLQQASPFNYPEGAWDDGAEGETTLMVHVTELGSVDSVYVKETSGREELDSAAIDGARTLRFEPARRGEETVEVWVRLPVRFALDGGATMGAGAVRPAEAE